jgi:hypothetical protein
VPSVLFPQGVGRGLGDGLGRGAGVTCVQSTVKDVTIAVEPTVRLERGGEVLVSPGVWMVMINVPGVPAPG